jgi:hypothetical protein
MQPVSILATRHKANEGVIIKGGGEVMKTNIHHSRSIFHRKWFVFFTALTAAIITVGICKIFGADLFSHPILVFSGALIFGLILTLLRSHDSKN